MGQKWLPNEQRRSLESVGRMVNGHECCREHDAVGIVDDDAPANVERTMRLHFEEETEIGRRDLDSVQRPSPIDDLQTGLFTDLSRECFDERLAGIDDAARCTPIDRLILALVLDQQDLTACTPHDAACHLPLPQRQSAVIARIGPSSHRFSLPDCDRRCEHHRRKWRRTSPRYDLIVADDLSDPSERFAIEPTTPSEHLPDNALPFESLHAPQPIRSAPPSRARWLGFAAILIGGLLGGIIGWGTGDVLGQTSLWSSIGALIGAVFGAVGVGIVATLTLRAMNEWNAVHHPESDEPKGIIGDAVP